MQPNRKGSLLVLLLLVTGAGAYIALSAAPPAAAPGQSIDGVWDAVVVVNDLEIPFRIEFSHAGRELQGAFLNGDVKEKSSSGEMEADRIQLRFDYWNSDLRASLHDGKLEGSYDHKGRTGATSYPFRARRFVPETGAGGSAPSLAGEWILTSDGTIHPGRPNVWRFLVKQSGAEISASILRLDGDTGTLSGKLQSGRLVLSHFSGARPMLLEGLLRADGSLEGTLNRRTKFTAVRKSEALAKGLPLPPDPSRYTSVKDPSEPLRFQFPDLEGRTVSNADPRFRGKVVIVNIMGSWCPNCQDEGPFLAELYRKYHDQGLEIVGLCFESGDLETDRKQVRAFMRRHGINYPMLLAGVVEPGAVPKALPQLVNFDSYPTSIFLGRDGRVRGVHDGFASPATGEEHVRLKQEIDELVRRLLAERAAS